MALVAAKEDVIHVLVIVFFILPFREHQNMYCIHLCME